MVERKKRKKEQLSDRLRQLTSTSVVGVPELHENLEFTTDENGFHNIEIPLLQSRCAFWLENAEFIPI